MNLGDDVPHTTHGVPAIAFSRRQQVTSADTRADGSIVEVRAERTRGGDRAAHR